MISSFLIGCGREVASNRTEPTPHRLPAAAIARVGETTITREAFEEEWKRSGGARSKEDVLQEMIRFESLLANARGAGLDRDPEIVAAFNRMVVGKFQEDAWRRRGVEAIPSHEAEIQAYYESHSDEFTTPRQVRLGIIYSKASAKATLEKRDRLRQSAKALWDQAKASDDRGFGELARRHSDDQVTRYAGGDTGWFTPEQATSPWEPGVIQAAAALSQPGDLAPLVETDHGFYVVKLLGHRPATRRPLGEVRDGIAYRLRTEKARQAREAFFREVQAGLAIEINRAALDAIPEQAIQTARPPVLPQ